MHEIIKNRLYTSRKDIFNKSDLENKSVVIDLSGNPKLVLEPRAHYVYLHWDIEDDVPEAAFDALVRFCASMMRADGTSVLIIGHQDTLDTIAACVVREHLGCNAKIAMGIIRESHSSALMKPVLIETVQRYKIS